MTALLVSLGVALAVAGVVIFPVAAHAMLEALPPRSVRRLLLSLAAVVINMGTMAGGIGLVWLATM